MLSENFAGSASPIAASSVLSTVFAFTNDNEKIVMTKERTIVFKERGEILLLKLAQSLEDYANVEELPKLEGKRMFLMLSPKK